MKAKRRLDVFALISAALVLSGCIPSEIRGTLPSGGVVTMQFYPGESILDDLLIFEGQNYFGTAQYQFDDPIADIGFRFNSGERAQAECILVGPDIIGQEQCKRYKVYRSSWGNIPVGTVFERPDLY